MRKAFDRSFAAAPLIRTVLDAEIAVQAATTGFGKDDQIRLRSQKNDIDGGQENARLGMSKAA